MTLEYEINEAAQERAKEMAKQLAVGIVEQLAVGMAEKLTSERLLENAGNLIREGFPIDAIARSFGLSPEQVERLKESL